MTRKEASPQAPRPPFSFVRAPTWEEQVHSTWVMIRYYEGKLQTCIEAGDQPGGVALYTQGVAGQRFFLALLYRDKGLPVPESEVIHAPAPTPTQDGQLSLF